MKKALLLLISGTMMLTSCGGDKTTTPLAPSSCSITWVEPEITVSRSQLYKDKLKIDFTNIQGDYILYIVTAKSSDGPWATIDLVKNVLTPTAEGKVDGQLNTTITYNRSAWPAGVSVAYIKPQVKVTLSDGNDLQCTTTVQKVNLTP